MKYGLYVVRDKLAEEAGPPFMAVNDKVAMRQFKNMNIPESLQDEYELMLIGYYDSKEMFLVPELYYKVVEVSINE